MRTHGWVRGRGAQRGATRSVCSARPKRPRSSPRTDSAVALPRSCGRVTASTQTHSPSGRRSSLHGQVDVDEDELAEVDRGADPVADVGGDQDALQGRRLLVPDEGVAHPQPGGRRADLGEAAGDEADLHRRVVALALAGREEAVRAGLARQRRARRDRDRLGGEVDRRRPQPPGPRQHQDLAVDPQLRLQHLHPPPGPHDPRLHLDRPDRDRAQDLEGDPADLEVLGFRQQLELAAEQRRRRPGVLGARVPGAAGQPGREVAVAVGLVEGGHAAILAKARSALVAAEVLGPDGGAFVAFEPPIRRPMPISL